MHAKESLLISGRITPARVDSQLFKTRGSNLFLGPQQLLRRGQHFPAAQHLVPEKKVQREETRLFPQSTLPYLCGNGHVSWVWVHSAQDHTSKPLRLRRSMGHDERGICAFQEAFPSFLPAHWTAGTALGQAWAGAD